MADTARAGVLLPTCLDVVALHAEEHARRLAARVEIVVRCDARIRVLVMQGDLVLRPISKQAAGAHLPKHPVLGATGTGTRRTGAE